MNKNKNYYYDLSLAEIEKIKSEHIRPIIGIHACCAPCMAFPLEFLAPIFSVKILYCNSNIYPSTEYNRRLNELKKYVDIFNKENNQDVEIIEFPYENNAYNQMLSPYSSEPEGGKRCLLCYTTRMEETYKYAHEHGYDYFTTVMTISRQKNSAVLNQIGAELSKKYSPKYFFSDFKKKKGIDRGIELRKKYDLYNQEYCGCVYSFIEYQKKCGDK